MKFDPWKDVRERRRRGTRKPLDWRYNFRWYLMVSLVPWGLFWGGIDLLHKSLWQKGVGLLLILASVASVGLFVRWLLMPIDPEALRRQRAFNESMKWSNIRRDWKNRKQKPPRAWQWPDEQESDAP